MKTLILIAGLAASTQSWATSLHPDTFKNECFEKDFKVLRQAHSLNNPGVSELVHEIVELQTSCKVEEKAHFVTAVCGASTGQELHFTFKTVKFGEVNVVVDVSQRQCQEIFVVPSIKSVTLKTVAVRR